MSQTTQTPAPKSEPNHARNVEALLMSQLVSGKKDTLKNRIKKLVESGRIGKNYAEKTLLPKVEAFSMSASDLKDDGSWPKSAIEELLDGLEEATPLVGESLVEQGLGFNDLPLGAESQGLPQDYIVGDAVADVSEADANAIFAEMGL